MATSSSAYANATTQREAARTTVAVIGAGFLGKYVRSTLFCVCVCHCSPLRNA